MENERVNQQNIELKKSYQIKRAKEYLKNNKSKNDSDPRIDWCIISDLLNIIDNKCTI